jgi:hypothetical protein
VVPLSLRDEKRFIAELAPAPRPDQTI